MTTARCTHKGGEAWRCATRGCERGITNLAACQGVKDAAHVRRGNHTASARVVVGRTCRCKSCAEHTSSGANLMRAWSVVGWRSSGARCKGRGTTRTVAAWVSVPTLAAESTVVAQHRHADPQNALAGPRSPSPQR